MSANPPAAKGPHKAWSGKSEKTAIWRLLAAIVIPLLGILSKITIRGGENVPKSGAFVVAPNHFTNIDPLTNAVALYRVGRVPRYLAKASLWKVPVLGAAMRATQQIPVEREGHTRDSDPLAAARAIAKSGMGVIIYPEGSLTRDPGLWPMRGKFGAVRTALDADIPLIPSAHWGDQLVLPRYGKLSVFPRKKVTVVYGEPVDLSEFRGKPIDATVLLSATNRLMHDITALLEQLRGETAPLERWDPAVHHQSETGKLKDA